MNSVWTDHYQRPLLTVCLYPRGAEGQSKLQQRPLITNLPLCVKFGTKLMGIRIDFYFLFEFVPTYYVSFCSQYTTKDGELKAQLHSVGTLLPTVQMHLILCTTFTSTANKHEFLTLAYQLIDRLTALAHLSYPLR